ncbi:MAG: hypothetical protein K8I04_05585 [Gammaproteobacteria bacterium]|nr:hypothetical protein [Gammaproteobacteria bacterium]
MASVSLQELLETVLQTRQLTQEELAELLAAETGRHVTRTRLVGWLGGASPRGDEEEIRAALERVMEAEPEKLLPALVSKEQVAAEVRRWFEAGLTRKQVMIAAEMPQSTLSAWELGRVEVPRRRFDRIKALIDIWVDTLTETGHLK